MQFLVDRQAIAQDIYQGAGNPMITHVGPNDPDFLTIYDIDRGSGITYDPELARELIAEEMTAAGAELVDGVWQLDGRPIIIKLVARVEDERREIGDLIRVELEAAGFQVAQSYEQFAPAIQKVYSTDPQQFQWHIYTEGWGRGAPQRYDVGSVNSYNAPWLGNMPGWRESGFWQYENEAIDELGLTLVRGEFDSREERDEIYRTMTEAGLDESDPDLAGHGQQQLPHGRYADRPDDRYRLRTAEPVELRAAFVPGKDDITVGHQWVWTERTTYNPVGGFGDVYSVDLWRNLVDPGRRQRSVHGHPAAVPCDLRGRDRRTGGHARATRRRAALGRRDEVLGPGRPRHDRGQQGDVRLLRLPRRELAPRPTDHDGRRYLLAGADVRPRLRRGQGPHRDGAGGHDAAGAGGR